MTVLARKINPACVNAALRWRVEAGQTRGIRSRTHSGLAVIKAAKNHRRRAIPHTHNAASLARPGRQAAPSLSPSRSFSLSSSLSSRKEEEQMTGTARSLPRMCAENSAPNVRHRSQEQKSRGCIIRSENREESAPPSLTEALDGTPGVTRDETRDSRPREGKKKEDASHRESLCITGLRRQRAHCLGSRPVPACEVANRRRSRGGEVFTSLPLKGYARARACADHLPAQFFSVYLASRITRRSWDSFRSSRLGGTPRNAKLCRILFSNHVSSNVARELNATSRNLNSKSRLYIFLNNL